MVFAKPPVRSAKMPGTRLTKFVPIPGQPFPTRESLTTHQRRRYDALKKQNDRMKFPAGGNMSRGQARIFTYRQGLMNRYVPQMINLMDPSAPVPR